ncbi:type IX secretion system motor protein PorM/GldM [Pseudofulvibacter geojedonensis]|uniref:Gliding motility protein GldM n=1 Tax=Pseudofulvibacter geojedonensis TaxID=1123758 RepID=A0ABW3I356_9FLAO
MAGGNLSPRQKMINLMYLVLIAMLALNMSKEVLSAFGIMNNKFVENNKNSDAKNAEVHGELKRLAGEQPDKYVPLKGLADNVSKESKKLVSFIDGLKADILKPYEADRDEKTGELPYQSMDKGDKVDEAWFAGDNMSPKGKEIVKAFDDYRKSMMSIVGAKNPSIKKILESKFNTDKVKANDGATKSWLDYNFKGFPAIASVAKLSAYQSDVKNLEYDILSVLLTGKQKSELSMDKYNAFVIPEKTAFFNGENFKGRIVLGRYDDSTKPNKVILNGQEIDKKNFKDGGVVLDFPAGAVGERELKGEFVFLEDGKEVKVGIESAYAVVPKPNSATISADKMNVVYRGIPNPMTISFAGISDNKVSAAAPGLRKSGKGYIMTPSKGREVTINVTGTLPDGSKVSDRKKFRIKDIPRPQAAVSGAVGTVKKSKNSLKNSSISAVLEGFAFDLKLQVTTFKFKVPGQATITCNGSRLNDRAKSALMRAKRGESIQIFDMKTKVVGSPVKTKPASPCIVELTN